MKMYFATRALPVDCRMARVLGLIFVSALLLLLSACGSGAGNAGEGNLGQNQDNSYAGPAALNADVASFQATVWETLKSTSRCGGCHHNGPGPESFVNRNDINAAYAAAVGLVNLASPDSSAMAVKVRNGHNCWSNCSANANVIATQIDSWASGASSGGSGGPDPIVITPPPISDAGGGKSFGATSVLFEDTWQLLRSHCSGCHTDTAPVPQAPYFAHEDRDIAYEAVVSNQKVNLDVPSESRLVVRLRQEFHNCWTASCANDANIMEAAIQEWADAIAVTVLDPTLVVSKAMKLGDGIVASGGTRDNSGVIALYQFKTGSGNTVYDTSGVEPAIDLTLSGTEDVDFSWVGGWGVEFLSARALDTQGHSAKLHDLIAPRQEYTLEAWVVPANVVQEGPAHILSYSAGSSNSNFMLGQTEYRYEFTNRSTSTDANGGPSLITDADDEDLQATQQHVVVTYNQTQGRRIYVNGVATGDVDTEAPGLLNDWDDSYALVFGNETAGGFQWQGKLRLVAIYNKSLNSTQITRNFDAGVGEKFYLLFAVGTVDEGGTVHSGLAGVPDNSYIMFTVSEFDDYAYLFAEPRFINLDESAGSYSLQIKNMSIGLNGKIPAAGQAFRNLDVTVDSDAVLPAPEGYALDVHSASGTIIPKEKGVELDEFFLSFEIIGTAENAAAGEEPPFTAPPVSAVTEEVPDLGLRTFEELYISMAEITSVDPNDAGVRATYDTVQQQLPVSEDIRAFLSSHQVAISQLAIAYCDALVDSTSLRTSFFPDFTFTTPASTAFDSQPELDAITTSLLNNVAGQNLADQPDPAAMRTELEDLMLNLAGSCTTCDAARTQTVVKAACAAALGSAALLIQ